MAQVFNKQKSSFNNDLALAHFLTRLSKHQFRIKQFVNSLFPKNVKMDEKLNKFARPVSRAKPVKEVFLLPHLSQ